MRLGPDDFVPGEIVVFMGVSNHLYQGHDIFVPADKDGPFNIKDVRQLGPGTYVRITSILSEPIGGLIVKTLDDKWRRKVYISQVNKLSPLEQLAVIAEEINDA